jgi:hypothetical protein
MSIVEKMVRIKPHMTAEDERRMASRALVELDFDEDEVEEEDDDEGECVYICMHSC